MRCILYVHNHHGAHAVAGARSGRVCGMAVGEDPVAQRWDAARPITSFAEFSCPGDLEDPATAVELAVARAFARSGTLAPGQTVAIDTPRWNLRLGLEPGFDDPRAVLEPLLQLAHGLRVRGGKVIRVGAVEPAAAPAR